MEELLSVTYVNVSVCVCVSQYVYVCLCTCVHASLFASIKHMTTLLNYEAVSYVPFYIMCVYDSFSFTF